MTDAIPQVIALTMQEGFIYGLAGGVSAEVSGLFKIRKIVGGSCPDYMKSYSYWVITILMALVGGGLVSVYIASGIEFKPILALNIGATAPLFFEAIVRKTPDISPGNIN